MQANDTYKHETKQNGSQTITFFYVFDAFPYF